MDFAINIFHATRRISEGTMIFCQMPPETGRHDPPRYPLISLFAFFVPRTIFLLIVEENLMAHFFVNFSGRKKIRHTPRYPLISQLALLCYD